jgi:hypothetical protein
MKHQIAAPALVITIIAILHAAAPTLWLPRGPGGGGALFSPSINPGNPDEFYVSCDMSELFHTANFAASHDVAPFTQVVGGHESAVCFTNNPLVRYCISFGNWQIAPVKSIDGGATWSSLPGNPDASEQTYFIAADYDHSDRIVIAYYGSIHFSSNGGTSFRQIHAAPNSGAGVLVGGAFFAGDSICIGTSDGLLLSTNGGTTFAFSTATGIPAGQRIYSFTGAKADGVTRLFALTADSGNIWPGMVGSDYGGAMHGVYSLDYGASSWTSRMTGITPASDRMMYVAMAGNDITTVYLGGADANDQANIMKSTNGGQSWTHMLNLTSNQNMITGWCGWQGDINWGWSGSLFGLAVCLRNANRVLFTDWGFITKTSDGGASWQQAYTSISDQNAAGSATPKGKSYHSVGLENTSCWQVFWIDSLNMFAPYTDVKGMRSVDGGTSWSFNYTGHSQNTMYWMVKHPATGTLYAATSSIHDLYESTYLQDVRIESSYAAGKVLYSTNGGAAWQDLHDFGKPVYWVALDPANANRLYASVVDYTHSLGGIYVTNNLNAGAGATWAKLANPPRTQGHPAVIAVLNDGTVVSTWSGRRDSTGAFIQSSGVFTYNPSNQTWSDVSHAGMRYWTRDIVIDPFDAAQNTWYACVYSGWGGPANDLGGLYRTVNRGQTWVRLTNTADILSVPSCAINPDNHDEMFVTTESNGLWYTSNLTAAAPVFSLVTSYPFSHPQRVFFNPYNHDRVWIASFGNGMRIGSMGGNAVRMRGIGAVGRTHMRVTCAGNTIVVSGINAGDRITIIDAAGRMAAVTQESVISVRGWKAGAYAVKVGARCSRAVVIGK